MKLGVVIAVSTYSGSGLSDLPGCVLDASLIQTILQAQDGFEDVLVIKNNTNSVSVKQQLIDYVNKYKGQDVAEFVFYYTGHGVFLNNEYYYLLSDYQQSKLRQTTLENTELDNLIRSLNPTLTTKLVDSCQSGLPYIKDSGEVATYLKGTQSGFHNCYFLFSSHTDESSYQDSALSAFTRCVGELVASRTGVVRHKDIIDYVSDSFSANTHQSPFFVVQADFTDQFCKVDSALQKKVASILGTSKQPSMATSMSLPVGNALKTLIEEDAKYYCSKEEAIEALMQLSEHFNGCRPPTEAQDIYTIEVTQLTDYASIQNMVAIGKWLKESNHSFFAEPISENVKVRKPKLTAIFKHFTSAGALSTMSEDDYDEVYENRITGAKATTEMPYSALLFRANSLYPNLSSTGCFIVPFISRTHILLFIGSVSYIARGWGEQTVAGEVKWRPFEERMKDDAAMAKTISGVMKEFWEFTINPVKKKFGLFKDEAVKETNSVTNNEGEQADQPVGGEQCSSSQV